ncbi:unnamed protein product [Cyprideis torosa]|uniref:Uncharacterized protein n=1 Tax=Cyprideis torosa TaxID=163714 RepID=A0A7R8WQ70_9CRUS|nr:unnamed protein product [Cyprideis torosa]CAG0902594.1 unnamed protein product [Cyprideis torosa]
MGDTASKDRRPIISGQRGTGVDATTNDIHERPQYRLVSPPPEEFTCSICTELLFDPVEISICDHLFCRKCVTDWLKRSRTCPECRTPATFLREANRNLRNFLANLSVHCPEEFCDDIVTIAELEQHVKTCRNVQTLCEKGCEQLLLKSERKHHDCLQKLKHLLLEERTHGKDRMMQQKETLIQELQKVINDQARTMEEHEEILEAALSNFQGKNDLLIKENESLMPT